MPTTPGFALLCSYETREPVLPASRNTACSAFHRRARREGGQAELLPFGESAVLDLIDRETDAFGIPPGVELDLADGGVDLAALERLAQRLEIGPARHLDGVDGGQRRCVGLIEEGPRLLAELRLVLFTRLGVQGQLRDILRSGRIDPFGVLTGDLEEAVALDAVRPDKGSLMRFLFICDSSLEASGW